jgi:hypothetical protein
MLYYLNQTPVDIQAYTLIVGTQTSTVLAMLAVLAVAVGYTQAYTLVALVPVFAPQKHETIHVSYESHPSLKN